MGEKKGTDLESSINKVNKNYLVDNIAFIRFVDVPIILTKKGLVSKSSTVDYVGLLNKGKFIAFDAKDTQSKTSFPLKNIKTHQINYLNKVKELGGIAFFLIRFRKIDENVVYLLPINTFLDFINNNDRKSIPINFMEKESIKTELDNYVETVMEEREKF